ncbi:MAG: hypothetical protein A2284_02795 [Deltaproteobacteria bacterium RIFOXYA12_FULL_61_11]|nr:MAG: hypothetical protein A2284_02795 [Deltaproteobacteria bacterium RIFOXYA12_FULL_61_11]
MRMVLAAFLSLALVVSAKAQQNKQLLMVADVKVTCKGFSAQDKSALEETLRTAVKREIGDRLGFMSKENLYEVLGDNNIDPAVCNDYLCEVELFRKIQVDYGITPVLTRLGDKLRLHLKLYVSSNGEELNSVQLDGLDLPALDRGILKQVSVLLEPLFARGEKDVLAKVEAEIKQQEGRELKFRKIDNEVITFISIPPKAALFINGKAIGDTGLKGTKQALAYGIHKIRLELPEYLPEERQLEISKGMTERTLTIVLSSALRRVEIDSTPEQGAEVFLDNQLLGRTPLQHTFAINSKPYELSLKRDLFKTASLALDITRETTNAQLFTVVLEPNYGLLDLSSEPPGIAVFLDDEPIGTTPLKNYRLPLGVFNLALRDPAWFEVSIDKLQVTTPLETLVHSFTLQRKFGGLDLGCHDEQNGVVVAEVFLDGEKLGETDPRLQHELPVGTYRLTVKTEHRTITDLVVINDHGDMYQKDLLLRSLSDEELAALARKRCKQELETLQTRDQAEQRLAEQRRLKHLVVLVPAAMLAVAAGIGGGLAFGGSLNDDELADQTYQDYLLATPGAQMEYLYAETQDLRERSRWKLLGAGVLGIVALGAAGVAVYEYLALPPMPAPRVTSSRGYALNPTYDGELVGLALTGWW